MKNVFVFISHFLFNLSVIYFALLAYMHVLNLLLDVRKDERKVANEKWMLLSLCF